jgi:hypothetical protein
MKNVPSRHHERLSRPSPDWWHTGEPQLGRTVIRFDVHVRADVLNRFLES